MEESKPLETPSIPAEVSALEAAPIEETTTTETIGIAVEPASTSDFSIVEVLQLGTNASLKNQLNLKPIDSLKTGIGLNEKFLYIRELFGNDHINFANTIAALNDFSNIQAAESLLHKQFIYTGKWDLLNPHVQTFLQTIYRRFA
jgi:hypothetical protein